MSETELEEVRSYSWKFYVGIVLIVLSTLIGVATKILIFIYLQDVFWFWFNIILYILSWPMLILGVWWVGKEYADKIKRYASYRFYQESLKKGTQKAYTLTKAGTVKLRDTARRRSERVRAGARKLKSKMKEGIKKPFSKKSS